MNKENINYIKRSLDLNYCLDKFIDTNLEKNKDMYVLHLNSLTKDKDLFVNKIWKHFRDRILNNAKNKYCIDAGVGGLELDENGNWHIHLIITYNQNYADNTRFNKNTELRKLWLKINEKYTGEDLSKQRFICEPLIIGKRDRLTKYISKPIKHTRRGFNFSSYLPKGYGRKATVRVSLGNANKLWSAKQMPSWKLSNKQVAESLLNVWNEFKYNADTLHNCIQESTV